MPTGYLHERIGCIAAVRPSMRRGGVQDVCLGHLRVYHWGFSLEHGMPTSFPWMKFWVNDWLSSPRVTAMTAEQRGAYIQLIAFCWASGDASLPGDDETLARLSGANEGWFNGGCQMVRDCFDPHPDKTGALTQHRVYDEWQKMVEWSEKSKKGGRKSGQARKIRRSKGGSTTVQPPYEPNGNQTSTIGSGSVSISSSESKTKKKAKNFTPPTVPEVRAYCSERLNQVDSGTFVDYYEAQGWKLANGQKMADWKAAVRTWEKRTQKPERPRVARISEL